MPPCEAEDDPSELACARVAVAAVVERQPEAQAGVASIELFESPCVVFGRGERFVEGNPSPETSADQAHAVAVEGTEAEAFVLEFGEGDGIAVEGIVIPGEADTGGGGIAHGGYHLSETVGGFEDGVGAEDEDEVSWQEVETEVQDFGVVVGRRPFDDLTSGREDVGGGGVGAAAIDTEEDIGLECLFFDRLKDRGQGGSGIGEADEDAEGER